MTTSTSELESRLWTSWVRRLARAGAAQAGRSSAGSPHARAKVLAGLPLPDRHCGRASAAAETPPSARRLRRRRGGGGSRAVCAFGRPNRASLGRRAPPFPWCPSRRRRRRHSRIRRQWRRRPPPRRRPARRGAGRTGITAAPFRSRAATRSRRAGSIQSPIPRPSGAAHRRPRQGRSQGRGPPACRGVPAASPEQRARDACPRAPQMRICAGRVSAARAHIMHDDPSIPSATTERAAAPTSARCSSCLSE